MFYQRPTSCRALAAVPAQIHQIRCTGIAYGDIRTKSAAQVPHLLTFASMSLQIRCTGTAYAHFRTKSAAQAPHMLTFASMSLQIRCTGTAYAHFRCNFVVNPPSLRTETPSAAVWAKPSWIYLYLNFRTKPRRISTLMSLAHKLRKHCYLLHFN